jgi:hypothetical protein
MPELWDTVIPIRQLLSQSLRPLRGPSLSIDGFEAYSEHPVRVTCLVTRVFAYPPSVTPSHPHPVPFPLPTSTTDRLPLAHTALLLPLAGAGQKKWDGPRVW